MASLLWGDLTKLTSERQADSLDKSGKEAGVKSIAKRNIPTITDRQDNSARTDMALPGPISRAGWDRWRW